jgi:hypothetical protein
MLFGIRQGLQHDGRKVIAPVTSCSHHESTVIFFSYNGKMSRDLWISGHGKSHGEGKALPPENRTAWPASEIRAWRPSARCPRNGKIWI